MKKIKDECKCRHSRWSHEGSKLDGICLGLFYNGGDYKRCKCKKYRAEKK